MTMNQSIDASLNSHFKQNVYATVKHPDLEIFEVILLTSLILLARSWESIICRIKYHIQYFDFEQTISLK